MRKTHLFVPSLFIAGLLALSGCTDTSPSDPDTPKVTNSTPTQEPTVSTSPASEEYAEDFTALDALEVPEGIDVEVVKASVLKYLDGQLNPLILSGQWTQDDQWLDNAFGDVLGEQLRQEIAVWDINNPVYTPNFYSLAAFFTVSDQINVTDDCDANSKKDACLVGELTITDVSVTQSEISENVVLFTGTIQGKRSLLVEGKPASSTISYVDRLWIDVTTGQVVSIQNDYSFGNATTS